MKHLLTIVNEVKETLKKRRLFDKCIFFPGNNCNINFVGICQRRGNIFTHLKNEVPALVGVGCPAHILNNNINQMILDTRPMRNFPLILFIQRS